PYSMIYGMAGGILSLIFMCFFKRCKNFSIVGVSIAGGIFHNIGQLAVAAFVVKELRIAYYAPLLIIAGTIAGFLIGIVSGILYKRLSGLKNF
ncbi:MAG TPA: Gx transporter family protein, partial [Lachnospiraceae bacterium]|nr:Gx transporter family protein [Lachnospiraceae bacterium]